MIVCEKCCSLDEFHLIIFYFFFRVKKMECIFCCSPAKDLDGHLISPQDHKSWCTVLNAAIIRKCDKIIGLGLTLKHKEVPSIVYHKQCRSTFVMKRDLNSLIRKAGENNTDNRSLLRKPLKRLACETRIYPKECIFCGKDKYVKGTHRREKLRTATQLKSDETLS